MQSLNHNRYHTNFSMKREIESTIMNLQDERRTEKCDRALIHGHYLSQDAASDSAECCVEILGYSWQYVFDGLSVFHTVGNTYDVRPKLYAIQIHYIFQEAICCFELKNDVQTLIDLADYFGMATAVTNYSRAIGISSSCPNWFCTNTKYKLF